MALTLADLQGWDPEQIDDVAQAAAERARTSREKAKALANLPVLANWEGAGGEAAREALRRSSTKLELSAQDAFRVSIGAGQAYQEALEVKRELSEIFADAAVQPQVSIDTTTNTVIPPDTSGWADEDVAKLQTKIDELQGRIAVVLENAEQTDADLARVVAVATGQEPVDAAEPTPDPRSLRPPPGASQRDVTKWWHSLTPAQQNAVKASSPESIRNLDGIPGDVRNQLNLPALQREITRLQNGWLDGNGVWHTDQAKLTDLKALQTTLHDHPGSSLILLDTTSNPDKVLAAVGVGDVDNAERVGVTVGGFNTRVSSSVDEMVREADAQRSKARDLRIDAGVANPDAVASIAWLGYDAPDSVKGVAHDWLAREAAGPLNSFYKGLDATTNVADQHITAFGHSYGSLTTSLALQQGAPVDDVVLYGSPGAEITNAAQLGVPPGHAYYMIGVNDHVADVIPGFGAFGSAPQDVPGMSELSVNTGTAPSGSLGDGLLHERAYGHSEYARDGSNDQLRMSGYNMAAVLAGLPDDLIQPPPLPSPTIPSGPGPFGLPVPNPDYEP